MSGARTNVQGNRWRRPAGNGFRETGKAAAIAVLMSLPLVGIGGYIMYSDRAEAAQMLAEAARREQAHVQLINAPALPVLPVERVAHGRDLFLSSCAACHSADGSGVAGLGKDLTTSAFVASSDDHALHAFLVSGRPLAQPLPMPPRGGNPDLTDEDLEDLVVYMRAIQDRRRMPELPEPVLMAAAPSEAEKEQALAAAGGDEELAAWIASGAKLFAMSCVSCHGKDARGIAGNGKDLVNSEFCRTTGEEEMLAFLKKGRDPSDPANTTGIGMPAKGGNPALSDDDLLDIIAYIHSLQTASAEK